MMIEPSLASKLEAPCLLSVVVPVFNEEAVLPAFHQRLGAVLGDLGDDCEVLYVDDGSTDRSATILAQLRPPTAGWAWPASPATSARNRR